MNCEQTRDYMEAAVNKELGGEDLILFRSHLQQCAACKREFRLTIKRLYQADLKRFDLLPLPEKKIHENLHASGTAFLSWRVGRFALVAALVLIVSLFFLQPEHESAKNDSSFAEVLKNHDWQALKQIVDDPTHLDKYRTENVPVSLIRETVEKFNDRQTLSMDGFRIPKKQFQEIKASINKIIESKNLAGNSGYSISVRRLQSLLNKKRGA